MGRPPICSLLGRTIADLDASRSRASAVDFVSATYFANSVHIASSFDLRRPSLNMSPAIVMPGDALGHSAKVWMTKLRHAATARPNRPEEHGNGIRRDRVPDRDSVDEPFFIERHGMRGTDGFPNRSAFWSLGWTAKSRQSLPRGFAKHCPQYPIFTRLPDFFRPRHCRGHVFKVPGSSLLPQTELPTPRHNHLASQS